MRFNKKIHFAFYAALVASTTVLSAVPDRGWAAQSDDNYFASLTPAEQRSVTELAGRVQGILGEVRADQSQFGRDFAALHLMDVLKPQFLQTDETGSETARILSQARALVTRARAIRNTRDAEFGKMIEGSSLSPKLKEHYRSALKSLVSQAEPEREQSYQLVDQLFDEVEAAAKVLRQASWDHENYSTLAQADALAFNEHAAKANSLIRQKAALDARMQQEVVRRTQ